MLLEHIELMPRLTVAAPGNAAMLPGLPRPPTAPPVVVIIARARMGHDGMTRGALVSVEVAMLACLMPVPASASASAGMTATAAPVPAVMREKGKEMSG